jgi:hypothetical protein
MSVVYFWTPTSFISPTTGFLGEIVFSDQVVASGSYSVNGFCNFPCSSPLDLFFIGDPTQVNVVNGVPPQIGPGSGYEENIRVAFNSDGTLSGSINYGDLASGYTVSGSGNFWSGDISSDSIPCFHCGPLTGYWQTQTNISTVVSEPASWFLMSTALVVLALTKWRRQKAICA